MEATYPQMSVDEEMAIGVARHVGTRDLSPFESASNARCAVPYILS